MTDLYVLGGRQKSDAVDKEEWHTFKEAVVLRVDTASGAISECVSYVSPPDTCPDDDPSIVFKAGTLVGQHLYVCTQTEVLVYAVPEFKLIHHVSHPWFNDLHHVLPTPTGNVLVANTGLDMAHEVTLDGKAVREWNVAVEDTWARFSRDVDYRKVLTTKPHLSHPNHLCFIQGELWVTRAKFQDAICVTNRELLPIKLGPEPGIAVHDGRVYDDQVYFTSVDGRVIVVDAKSRQVTREIWLTEIAGSKVLGWCRGLELLENDCLVGGFSRLRPTRWSQNVLWVKHLLGGSGWGLHPTSLVAFDLKNRRVLWERDLEPHINAVFSIHRAEDT